MPVYEHGCSHCKETYLFHRPLSRAGDEERCPHCHAKTSRIYSVNLKKEFFAYDDAQYGCTISSEKEERRVMKQHGHTYFDETPTYNNPRWKSVRRLAKKKPIYSTSVKTTRMDRD